VSPPSGSDARSGRTSSRRERRRIDLSALTSENAERLLSSVVVPRPIAWISTISRSGCTNLAPHSYFSPVSSDPPTVMFVSTGMKDTLRNVLESGEFVVNSVQDSQLERMLITSAELPGDEDEFAWAEVERTPSCDVRPPGVADSAISLECRLLRTLRVGEATLVVGQVICAHVASEAMQANGRIDLRDVPLVGRAGPRGFTVVQQVIDRRRPRLGDLATARYESTEATGADRNASDGLMLETPPPSVRSARGTGRSPSRP
jgi:flavin reductase (DIM6/NTAB) family NADH-FMN oxidoreductase RutF